MTGDAGKKILDFQSFNKRVLSGCRLPPADTRAAVPSEVWGRELSGRAADSARG